MLRTTHHHRVYSLKRLLTLACLLFGIQASAVPFTASMIANPTNKSCYSGTYTAGYVATVPPPHGYTYPTNYNFVLTGTNTTRFDLRKASTGPTGTILATNYGGTAGGFGTPTISGTFNISSISDALFSPSSPREDVYTIYASIYVNDITSGNIVNIVTTTFTFTVGYNVLWSDMIDMSAPGTSTVKRSLVTSGITYGGAKSSNYVPAGTDGWIELAAQFSSVTTSRSVYIPLSDFVLTTTFVPSAIGSYLEYRKGGTITSTSGEGIYVKSGTSVYKLAGVVLTDRIRMERVSGFIKFYKANTTSALTWTYVSGATISSFPCSTELFVMAYAPLADDGVASPMTSFGCAEGSTIYARLDRSVAGTNYTASDKLYFYYDEEYVPVATSTLTYRILNYQHKTVQSSDVVSGSTQVTANRIYGDNRFELGLATTVPLGTYILEVTNEKKEVFYLRFTRR